jgi:lipopolysaccharide export system protein LptA
MPETGNLSPAIHAHAYNGRQINCNFRALKSFVPFLLSGLLLCGAVGVRAEKADRDKPMNIEADKLVHEDQRQRTLFSGKVVATKGTLIFRGEQLEVWDDQGHQFGQLIPASGQRAFFRQKREGLNEFMEGEAERIEYDGRADRVTLQGRAVLRRYHGAKLNDEMSGQTIVYDNVSERFTVDAVPGKGAAAGTSPTNARVRAWMTPAPSGGAPK